MDERLLRHPPAPPVRVDDGEVSGEPLERRRPGVVNAVGPVAARHDEQAPAGVLLHVQAVIFEVVGGDGQRPGLAPRVLDPQHQHFVLVVEPIVPPRHLEHQLVGGEVGAVGDPFAVVPLVPRVPRQHGGLRVHAAPFPPGGRDHRPVGQPAPGADERADHRHALEGVPEAPRPVVEHQLVRAVQQAAGPEPDVLAVDDALVGDDRAAQRAVDDGQLDAAQPVEGHLVPRQDPLGIGARLPAGGDAEHDVVVVEPAGLAGRQVRGALQRRNPVDGHPAPVDLVQADQREHAARKEVREAGIELRVPLPLEEAVVGMRIVRLVPDPLLRPADVAAEALPGPLLEKPHQPPPDAGARMLRPRPLQPPAAVRIRGVGADAGRPGRRLPRRPHQAQQVADDPRVAVPPARRDPLQGRVGDVVVLVRRLEEQADVGMAVEGHRLRPPRRARRETRREDRRRDDPGSSHVPALRLRRGAARPPDGPASCAARWRSMRRSPAAAPRDRRTVPGPRSR